MSQLSDLIDNYDGNEWSYEDPISTEEINEQIYKGRAMPLLDDCALT